MKDSTVEEKLILIHL